MRLGIASGLRMGFTLYDMPVSNHCARVRMILYYKDVTEVEIVHPVGGHTRTDEFLALNPLGKAPLLVGDGVCVAESDTIARMVGGMYDGREGPGRFKLEAGSVLAVEADKICRLHDLYLAPLQGSLYKASPAGLPWSYQTRDAAIGEFQAHLGALENMVGTPAPYLLGDEPTHADVALFPTLVFAERMLPKFDRAFELGPKLRAFWDYMASGADPVAARVLGEIRGGLDKWEEKDRWASVRGAGLRDSKDPTIFDKIINKEIPADIVYEDDVCLAFRDINPVAPVHVLLIPKRRNGLTQLRYADDDNKLVLGHLMTKVGTVAQAAGIEDFRLVVNDGADAGQTVFHLHLHIIGGRTLKWPPG